MSNLRLPNGVVIPEDELQIRAVRSSGPGGQGVNTTDSKVELRWDVAGSTAITDGQRQRLQQRLASRLTNDGTLILVSQEHRSQYRNREAVRARFRAIVGEALAPQRRRRPTRPSKAAKRRRLEAKRRRSEIKRLRKPPPQP